LRPVEKVLARLQGARELNGYWRARCPAHDDGTPSLGVKEGDDGRALVICRAGCETEAVVEALGLTMGDLFAHDTRERLTAVYEVRDADGTLQAEHHRYDGPNGKRVVWRGGLQGRKLATMPLYRSEHLRRWPADTPVVLVEGEKAADALAAVHGPVLGTVTGAEVTPDPEVLEALRGRRVVLWPDGDDAGRRHMELIGAALKGIASELRVFEWPDPPAGVKGPDAADHPAVLRRDPKAVGELLEGLRSAPVWKPAPASSSSLALSVSDDDDEDAGLLWFSEMGAPKPREFLVEDVLPAGYLSMLYGTGGVAKSMLALLLAIAVAGGAREWLGWAVRVHGRVLYLDFELEAEEQLRRVRELCAGARMGIPKDLGYLSALGQRTPEAFGRALKACKRHGARLMILDSMGAAMLGDAEKASDFLAFHNLHLAPFRAAGVTVLAIDHQGKLQAGENYRDKGAFGTAYKSHLSRSVIQVEKVGRDLEAGALKVRLHHKKTNFGPERDPRDVELAFKPGAITAETSEVDPAELANAAALSSPERVRLALGAGPAYPTELTARTGLAAGTVGNALTQLRKSGEVEYTGETDGRAKQVRLASSSSSSSSSFPLRANDDDDARPLSVDLQPGESSDLAELRAQRDGGDPEHSRNGHTPKGRKVRSL